MVDPVNSTGQIQPVGGQKPQAKQTEKQPVKQEAPPVDRVQISEEARALTQIEEMIKAAREGLSEDKNVVLSSGGQRLNDLV